MALTSLAAEHPSQRCSTEIHSVLQRRADAAGQSLQEYLLGRLRIEAETPTIDELFSRIEQRSGGNVSLKTAAQLVRAERDAK